MKLRNQLLALSCLLIFVALGFLYFRNWVVQKPFAIIVFTGDGITSSNLTAARLYEVGADQRLTIDSLPHLALLSNHANDFAIPDDAAAASALATGIKVNNRSVSVSPDGAWLKNLSSLAKDSGRAVGFVTNGKATAPGISAFYAHHQNKENTEEIAAQLLDANFDVLLGGGINDFFPVSKEGSRTDGRDLSLEMKQRGWDFIRTKGELENSANYRIAPLVGIFGEGPLVFRSQKDKTNTQPSLSDMVRRAIQTLQFNRKGYLLIVNTDLIGLGAHENDGEKTLTELIELDHAVATALDYAGDRKLVIVAGRSSIGGMSLNGYPLRHDYGVSLLGTNAFGYPSITWATGPKGCRTVDRPDESSPEEIEETHISDPAAFYLPQAVHVADDALGAGIGAGSEKLNGFLDNTAVFNIVKENL